MANYFITKNSGASSDTSDVFQEALIILYENAMDDKFNFTCTVKTYLYSIIRNLWLKHLKKRGRQVSINDFEKYLSNVAIEDDNLEENKIQEVLKHLKLLGDKCQQLLKGFYYEKKSMQILTAELGYTNADNTKNQKYKCISQLRKMMQIKGNG